MSETKYYTRWRDKGEAWHRSCEPCSKAEALEQYERDMRYFYSRIEIQLIEVVETVIDSKEE